MKAILRSWDTRESTYEDAIVEISDAHTFSDGPYVDTIPFSVGSNQEILEFEEWSGFTALDILRRLLEQGCVDHEGDFLLGDPWPDQDEDKPAEPAVITAARNLFKKLGKPLNLAYNHNDKY